ncbi:MAG: NAD(P)-dependent oxidoreductase [Jatrophihabitans sp.]
MTAPVAPDRTRVGWIGTGVMGSPMCGHVLAAGYPVTVFARRPDSVAALVDAGAALADSPAAVAATSDVIVSIVSMPADVRAVTLGDGGTLSAAAAGAVLIDMTTSEPSLAREIHAAAQHRGVAAVDAPVSGGDVGARNATLSMMVGGDADVVEAVTPLLCVLGPTVVHQGGPGAGQHTKMANQILIAGTMIGVCEGLLYAHRAGLDPTTVLRSVGSGAAASAALTNLAPRMIVGDYAPGFYVEHFCKDLGIALAEARRANLALPGLALADQLYQALSAQGLGRSGTQALVAVLAELSRVDWPPTNG